MKIIVVFGQKLLPSGELSGPYKLRLARALQLLSSGEGDRLVLTGGTTRAEFPSEAEAGFAAVPEHLKSRTVLETTAACTSENVKYAKRLLQRLLPDQVESLIIVTSSSHVPRTRMLVRKFWPELYANASFLGVGAATVREFLSELLFIALALVDPHDRVFLPHLKRLFRNASRPRA